MINVKQMELSQMIFDKLKNQFLEIELVNIVESPEDPSTLWIRITMPEDDEREIALLEMAAEMSADILEDYGYHILTIICARPQMETMNV